VVQEVFVSFIQILRMNRYLLSLSALLILSACRETGPRLPVFEKGTWIDLTYSFSGETLYWPTAETFKLDTAFEGNTEGGYFYSAYNFRAAEHGGTHLDAPCHFAKGKWSTDQVPLENLTGTAVVIDVSARALKNADYQVSVQDVEEWEKANGAIPVNAMVLFHTGYGAYYPDAAKYLGTTQRGAEAVSLLHFPGISPALAEWLVKNRKIKAVGLDTPSVDYGQSKDFQTHRILYAQNICGFENVANLDALPSRGAYIMALPMKIKGGSGAPLRIVAWVPAK
jgi:kynurenine formamidase